MPKWQTNAHRPGIVFSRPSRLSRHAVLLPGIVLGHFGHFSHFRQRLKLCSVWSLVLPVLSVIILLTETPVLLYTYIYIIYSRLY